MSIVLLLPSDVASHVGQGEISIDAANGRQAISQLVESHPGCRPLLFNSLGEVRETIQFEVDGVLIDPEASFPKGARVELIFIAAA